MFTLLNPAALLALLGLLVPVAIHLWNRRPGREVAVGSLRWLAAGANRRLRNLKLEQRWLLLLRAALLAVLAVAMAGPAWRQARPAARGQILLSPELRDAPARAALRPAIDSLRRRGYGLRWLAAGFPQLPGAAGRADSLGPRNGRAAAPAVGTVPASFQWARVQQAAGVFAGQPLLVLTAPALRGLQGAHPPLPATVRWQLVPTAAAATHWLQAATGTPDSLRLLLGHGTETQTTFRPVAVARPRPGTSLRLAGLGPLRFDAGRGGPRLWPGGLGADSAGGGAPPARRPVPVRTKPLRVVLYATAAFAPDARYLEAGLRAAAAGLAVPLSLTTTAQVPAPAAPPDWLFWLSAAPLPLGWAEAVRRGCYSWQQAPGASVADTALLAAGGTGAAGIAVFRRSPTASDGLGVPLWTDSRGRAVLSRRTAGLGAAYYLHTRLNPTWSELADDAELPARLLALLQPESTDDLADGFSPEASALDRELALYDQRAFDPAQLVVAGGSATEKVVTDVPAKAAGGPGFRQTDLRPWLVLLAGLLLLLERLLAARRAAAALLISP